MNQDVPTRERIAGIRRARESAARTLLAAVKSLRSGYSEKQLFDSWSRLVSAESSVLPFGWYQPPPKGFSVLVGTPPTYERLEFESLRFEQYWPKSAHVFSKESILYPYFSAIDSTTLMVGDHVGTYYAGTDTRLQDWIRSCYSCTRRVAESVEPGMKFSDLFAEAHNELRSLGASNNNFSLSGGLAADIGHTIPYFASAKESSVTFGSPTGGPEQLAKTISAEREFVSPDNHSVIRAPCAFTVEPQMIATGYPMVGFHVIAAVSDTGVQLIEAYDGLFEFFGMDKWIK